MTDSDDLALAKYKMDLDNRKHDQKLEHETRRERNREIRRVLVVLAWAVPLWVVRLMVAAFAGHTTQLGINFSMLVTVSMSVIVSGVAGIGIGHGVGRWKGRSQTAELERLRGRIGDIEKENEHLKRQVKSMCVSYKE